MTLWKGEIGMNKILLEREKKRAQLETKLLAGIKERLPELKELLEQVSGHWRLEDGFYRFYHMSFKVFGLQKQTVLIVETLRSLLPEKELNAFFLTIYEDGTGKEFTLDDNSRWVEITRPIVEAFFHARYFLELAVRYGEVLESPPKGMPSGWAAVLYLYNIR